MQELWNSFVGLIGNPWLAAAIAIIAVILAFFAFSTVVQLVNPFQWRRYAPIVPQPNSGTNHTMASGQYVAVWQNGQFVPITPQPAAGATHAMAAGQFIVIDQPASTQSRLGWALIALAVIAAIWWWGPIIWTYVAKNFDQNAQKENKPETPAAVTQKTPEEIAKETAAATALKKRKDSWATLLENMAKSDRIKKTLFRPDQTGDTYQVTLQEHYLDDAKQIEGLKKSVKDELVLRGMQDAVEIKRIHWQRVIGNKSDGMFRHAVVLFDADLTNKEEVIKYERQAIQMDGLADTKEDQVLNWLTRWNKRVGESLESQTPQLPTPISNPTSTNPPSTPISPPEPPATLRPQPIPPPS